RRPVARPRPLAASARTAPAGPPRRRSARQLVDAAVGRRLVVAPAPELGAVADAVAADVVEADLDDEIGPQRDPLQLLLALPAARVAPAALPGCVRREPVDERPLLGRSEPGRVADDPQRPVGVVE